jgi:hypothetical protein
VAQLVVRQTALGRCRCARQIRGVTQHLDDELQCKGFL